ncbi:MAG: CUAEP/CCAEP-tail radical SAM protein [Proteobacteria bacterium]|nr:CUAEP/CCAEP-tail radical SAM protein [Pseudomonadota bacterium]MDA1057716.1 CUAEP/CCAEP-tail radical SAM protein [Pseudomonadota bacterium]
MHAVLVSTYDLGHQPLGLASPAAWLREAGATVTCLDLSLDRLDEAEIGRAGLVAFHVPMHTATRLASEIIPRVRALNPKAHIVAFGLYAPVNEAHLRSLGVGSVIGGEYEAALVEVLDDLVADRQINGNGATIHLEKLQFRVPDRSGLPPLESYGKLIMADGAECVAGYVEASRGCKHRCRHCPVVPVYDGAFRIVQRDIVVADIAQQVAAGAQHISFGDPDFFNGPSHGIGVVSALHERFPDLTYDVTIKVEHLLRHRDLLPTLVETGCLFVTTAVEALDDDSLDILDKGHTRGDFIEALALARQVGLTLSPTFVAFAPWTSLASYAALLQDIADLDLVEHVAPVQLAIRLLVPRGSLLVGHAAMASAIGPFDAEALSYGWRHVDQRVDELQRDIQRAVEAGDAAGDTRSAVFGRLWDIAHAAAGLSRALPVAKIGATVPRMSEPWYCCAEPTDLQRAAI